MPHREGRRMARRGRTRGDQVTTTVYGVNNYSDTHIRLLGRGGHGAQSRGMMGRGVRGGGGGGGQR